MALLIELTPEEEQTLAQSASAQGIAPAEYAQQMLRHGLRRAAQQVKNQPAIATLRQWRAEALSLPAEERSALEAEWQEIRRDLDKWRESSRQQFAA